MEVMLIARCSFQKDIMLIGICVMQLQLTLQAHGWSR